MNRTDIRYGALALFLTLSVAVGTQAKENAKPSKSAPSDRATVRPSNVTYKKGENFAENPGNKHGMSKNASSTMPAKLLAVFVVNSNEMELTTLCKD